MAPRATTRSVHSDSTKRTTASRSKTSAETLEAVQAESKSTNNTTNVKRKQAESKLSTAMAKKVRLETPDADESKAKKADKTTLDRPAEPHITNAPLVTPRGSRLVPYDKTNADASPSKTGRPRPTTTTTHILDQACAHLIANDHTGKLKPLIESNYCTPFCPEGLAEECDPFKALCSGIMAQQVSGAAASSIKRKFIGLFPSSSPLDDQAVDDLIFPTPAQVAPCTVPFLRTAGLSERKAEYIKGLAEKFESGELSAAMLVNASDEEVLEKLIAVRGLGKWSVEMFATFGLKRMDILSTGDLGVQRGMAAYMGKDVSKLKAKGGGKWKYMSEQDMLTNSEKFAPYRLVPRCYSNQGQLMLICCRSVFMVCFINFFVLSSIHSSAFMRP